MTMSDFPVAETEMPASNSVNFSSNSIGSPERTDKSPSEVISPLEITTSTDDTTTTITADNSNAIAPSNLFYADLPKKHATYKKKKNSSSASVYHPPMLFCGECSSCSVPPPSITSNSFTYTNGSSVKATDGVDGLSRKTLQIRVYNLRNSEVGSDDGYESATSEGSAPSEGPYGQRSVLKAILMELDGVNNVTFKESHFSYRSSGDPETKSDEEVATPPDNGSTIDPTSCMIVVEYTSPSSVEKPEKQSAKDNPPEPWEDSIMIQTVMTRLTVAGFDFAMVSSPRSSINDNIDNGTLGVETDEKIEPLLLCQTIPPPNINDASHLFQPPSLLINPSDPISEPPPSCRSRLRVHGICCSSEVPAVRSILRPLPGVRKIGINVATKVVFIDHDPSVISASLLMKALNEERFGAEVLRDGELDLISSNTSVAGTGRKGRDWNDGPEGNACCRGNACCGRVNATCHTSSCGAQTSGLDGMIQLPRSKFVESTFIIPGLITFTNEEDLHPIAKLLRQNFFKDHMRAFHLHAPSRTLKVEHDPDLLSSEKILNVLARGLKVDDWGSIELAHDGAVENLALPVLSGEDEEIGSDALEIGKGTCFNGLKFNVVISGVFWVLSMLSFIGGEWEYLQYAGIGSVIFGMPPVVMKAWMTMRRHQFDANCMMMIAAFGALALGEFDEAASVSFLFAVSEWLEARATSKARRALSAIVSLRPDYANVVDEKTGGFVIVPAAKVPIGSLVSVRTGDKVPADGFVVEGISSVDESSLTGEARPVEKRKGSEVSAGSINVGSTQLVVRTNSTVSDSTVSRLIRLVEEAQANRSTTEKLVDAFARKYTPFVLVVAFFLCTVPWIFSEESGRYWTLNGLIIIVIACPCSLQISTPVTYSAGLAAAAHRGIIIKGGSKLEALGNVKTVIFDKTGTLTKGRFALLHLELVGELKTRRQLLELLAIMEGPSSHPLSATLVSAAKAEGVEIPYNISVRNHTILKGEGVQAYVNNDIVYVGNERLFRRLGMYNISSKDIESVNKWSREGGTVGYVGIDGKGIVGLFCVSDSVRDEAQDVVSTLSDDGVRVIMLTGDGDGAAHAVGKEIGLSKNNIKSQLLPEDKLHFVSSLKESTKTKHPSLCGKKKFTMMVGDGVNDAPALAVADVGVAMGQGAALAMEMSDVTLMDSNLSKLIFSMRMGAKVIRTVKENIAFSLLANMLAVGLTFAGKMTLLLAIASDVGVMLLVTLNGMKLLSRRKIDALERNESKRPGSKRKDGQRYEMQLTEECETEIV